MRRELEFGRVGAGLRLRFSRGGFSVYAMALDYDYDDEFERFLEFADSPLLGSRPRIEALVGSFLTQTQGTIDRQVAAGRRAHLRPAYARARRFVGARRGATTATSRSVALTWQYAQSARLDWMVTAGLVDSDRYGNIAFASIALGLRTDAGAIFL